MIEETIKKSIQDALKVLSLEVEDVHLEHPTDFSHGDYSTNIAMILAKEAGDNPRKLADKIVRYIEQNKPKEVEKIEVAGSGFINFYLSRNFFSSTLETILKDEKIWGSNKANKGKKVMVEYTDPNPFKVFHIGHLMSNTIGESISRIIEFSGAEVKRANYQGDVGLHVAKALWALKKTNEKPSSISALGEAYTRGTFAYEENEEAKAEINDINKKVYDRSDESLNELYDKGRKISLENFEKIYQRLGMETRINSGELKYFDYYFFESLSWNVGREIVEQNISTVFEKSDGAVVFRGEKYHPKLHTRVFLTSKGLPTYEAKELGLLKLKKDIVDWEFDESITITANEQADYFKVVLAAAEKIDKISQVAKKTKHISHGMMRLPTGKMSSRTGDVISLGVFLDDLEDRVYEIIKDREIKDKENLKGDIAIGAIKYSILKQSTGKNILFDKERELSFEGDSGPYLQYAHTRAQSILNKASEAGILENTRKQPKEITDVEKLLYRFPEVVERAGIEYEPHYVVTYLTELASAFSSYYAKEHILDDSEETPYKIALTKAFQITMKNGLWLLGINTPERM